MTKIIISNGSIKVHAMKARPHTCAPHGLFWTMEMNCVHRGKGWAHDDVIKWKHFPRNWPFVREIHRSPVNFPHKGQWRGALMFSLIYAWINDWVNNREAGDLRRQHGHYDVIVMYYENVFINIRSDTNFCKVSLAILNDDVWSPKVETTTASETQNKTCTILQSAWCNAYRWAVW